MTTSVHKRPRAALGVGLVAALLAAVAPLTSHADEILIIDKGHVDAFNVYVENSQLKMNLKEDVTGLHALQDPATVELHVKSAALTTLPDGIPGSPGGYLLPLTQDHNLLWPGWDTLGIQDTGFDGSVDINFVGLEGPGRIHLFSFGSFGTLEPLLVGDATEITPGAVRRQSYPAHTHANWVFSTPGVYKLSVNATGTLNGVSQTTETHVYTFTVGDEFKGLGYVPEPTEEPTVEPTEEPTEEPTVEPTVEPTQEPTEEPTVTPTPTPTATQSTTPSPKPTATQSTTPSPKPTATQTTAPSPKPTATQPPLKPTPSANPLGECKMSEVVREATEAEIAQARGGGSTTAGASGSTTVAANTHVHPNWVFSAPGDYTMTIRQDAKSKSGARRPRVRGARGR